MDCFSTWKHSRSFVTLWQQLRHVNLTIISLFCISQLGQCHFEVKLWTICKYGCLWHRRYGGPVNMSYLEYKILTFFTLWQQLRHINLTIISLFCISQWGWCHFEVKFKFSLIYDFPNNLQCWYEGKLSYQKVSNLTGNS